MQNIPNAFAEQVAQQDHQQLGKYIGDDLFDLMVKGYLVDYPSLNNSLRGFTENLPLFLSHKAPFKEHVILADIARFEQLLLMAFDAADDVTLTTEQLENLAQTDWPLLVLNLHSSVQLVKFNTSAVESFRALKNESTPPSPYIDKPHFWLIWRALNKVTQYKALEKEEFDLLDLIKQKQNFSALCQSLVNNQPSEKIAPILIEYINSWLAQGLLKSF
ncbi:hypothetical protein CJF42_00285 [Pseudoalteromonas sp. NBT06-2]|uniref:DUF2063 domain-containing protein n=1 Tax=Pseudoalteromonas sp. NBT06-2 TaxID=2025950 RepID=UPI000BA5C2DB|nr:DUF2063 domain-containing protein [Pseudoalteromonas sp. NBT06-2]PAJ76374.1 hypothetical protein CJF42_00285 [Pseudoalteromonas sp. NBT06-2]